MNGFTLVDSKLNEFLERNSFLMKHIFGPKSIACCEWTREPFNEDHIKLIFYLTYPTAGIKITYGIINLYRINGKALFRMDDSPERVLWDIDGRKHYIGTVLDETGRLLELPFFDPMDAIKTNLNSPPFAYLKKEMVDDIISKLNPEHNNISIRLGEIFLTEFISEYGPEPILTDHFDSYSDPYKMDKNIFNGTQNLLGRNKNSGPADNSPERKLKNGAPVRDMPDLSILENEGPGKRGKILAKYVWEGLSDLEISMKKEIGISQHSVGQDISDIKKEKGEFRILFPTTEERNVLKAIRLYELNKSSDSQ
jgi:hypothetical protein